MIIGLTGLAGSGKSTAARYLVEKHGFTLVKFAGPLKSMMRALGLGDREIEGDLKEAPLAVLNYKTPRYAMQTIGTEWGRELIGENLWVNVAMAGAEIVLRDGGRVVIDDCRFSNEADAVRHAGGSIVRLVRSGSGIAGGHSSEGQALPCDYTIENNDTIGAFKLFVESVLEDIEKKETRA